MGATATFTYTDWLALYPEFSNVSTPQATAQFGMAGIYLRNDGTGPIGDVNLQTSLLYMLTSHLCFLEYGDAKGAGGNQLVGRINSASQGSVSVGSEMAGAPGTAAWFNQTKYGANFWQATASYRTARYRPGPGACGFGVGAGFGPYRAGQPWLYRNG